VQRAAPHSLEEARQGVEAGASSAAAAERGSGADGSINRGSGGSCASQ